MAAQQMGMRTSGNVTSWLGTAAEKTALTATGFGTGSTFWETDTKTGYVWDGSAWQTV